MGMIRGQAFKAPQGGCHSQRELGARAQPGMSWNGFMNGQSIGGGETKVRGEAGKIRRCALSLWPVG